MSSSNFVERQPLPPPNEMRKRFPAMTRRLVPSGNRRWITPVVMLVLLLGIVAGCVIVSSVTQPHVQLDDGTVWVTSLKDHKAARFNVKNRDADAGVASTAARFDIAQHDGDTVIAEGTKASNIAASTVSVHGNTSITADMETVIGGKTAAVINTKTGNVWVGSASDIASVNPTSGSPTMKLGSSGAIAVTHDGVAYGYRPSDHAVLSVDVPHGSPSKVARIENATGVESFTVIGGTPVVAGNGKVFWPKGNADIGLQGKVTLQAPPTDGKQSGWVAAATPRGLALVNLHSGAVNTLPKAGKGDAARPVSTGGCVFAAWAQRAENYVGACDANGKGATYSSLESIDPTSQLVFRTNHRLVVLNDVINGNVWNPQDSAKVIKIQWNKVETKESKQQERNNDSASNQRHFSKSCSSQSGQIRAQEDAFGARTGSQQILDVLRNDEQTDCSVLHIDSVSAPDGANVSVFPVYDGRYLQLDASAAGAGEVTFSYEISDGRGQTASANVSLNLTDGEDRAPQQTDVPPEIDVEQGASYTANALESFSDPDGDPLTLVSASPQNTDQVTVSTRADGQLVFNAGSVSSGRAGIEVTVSDGKQTGTGMIYFSVKPANTLAAVIDPVARQTTPGTRTTIALKQYVHGTSAEPAQLTSVESVPGVSATMNAADMSIAFSASSPGTYYVPYIIAQGTIPATGLVRVEVQAVTGDAAKPVAANDMALLGADNIAIVEPLTNDVDPLGGVLSVTSVAADTHSGIKTGIVGNKRIYITARQVPTEPVQLAYTVANAAGSSTGIIILQPPALTRSNSVPKAENVTAQVRTGGIVSVNVLDHVTYSDGITVKLQDNLQVDKATFKGLVFVSGNTVRYQATGEPGSYPVTYTVKDNLGNTASATITIDVHRKDAADKAAPTPSDVEAQVAAGRKVQIPIALTGIDPDGDDVQLLGLGNKAPKLGRITEVGATYLVYEAYADSSGTDTFSYAVEDWTGQRATAQIHVGVFSSGSDSGVYARDDEITLRPNTATTVPVAQNDICGDNTDLTVAEHVESQGINGITVIDGMLTFTTPKQAGTYYVAYTVKNKAGLSDTATLTVNVDANAPIDPPTAYDYRVPAAATIDKKSVDVDVSQWIANPSGTADELTVGVDPSVADHAHVKGDKDSTTITVELTDETRAVPYTVTNTTYSITSTAFIQVPAYGVFPPTLRPKAPTLKVNARETITIDIADYVRVGAGKTAYVDGADSVSATKAADDNQYVNEQTLRFTAPCDYAGPASITFTATDGKRGKNDNVKIVNSAVLTLPITVIGRDVPAPTFSSSTIDVVAGESASTIDLKALTHSASGLYDDEKQYTYSGGASTNGVTAKVSSTGKLTVSADKTVTAGTTVNVPIAIAYAKGTVNAGLTVRVTSSTRPLARLGDKAITIKTGSVRQVHMLSDAFNPFPDTPLTVTGCVSDKNAKFTVDCSPDGVVSIKAALDIGASTNRVIVTVRDATQVKDREATGTINVSVTDKPDAPLLSAVSGKPQDGRVDLSWTAGSANGSPITEYRVIWGGEGSGQKSCGAATSCTVDGLRNGRTYTFKVQAKNEVGWSKESNAVESTPDKLPDAPTDVTAEAGEYTVTVTWKAPNGDFSAIDKYRVTLSGTNAPAPVETTGTSVTFAIENNTIVDGASYKATVQSHNNVNWSQPSKQSGDAKPWGKPDAPAVTLTNDDTRGTVTVESVGNTRNAGCKSIELSGDVTMTMSCSGSESFDIPERNLNTKEYVVEAIVIGKKATRSGRAKVTFTPRYTVEKPERVSVSGDNGICTVTWKMQGHADGHTVHANGFDPYEAGASERSHDFMMAPWQSCTSASVMQRFKGVTSKPTEGSASPVYVNKQKAGIQAPQLRWSSTDTDTIDITGGTVNMYGQSGKTMITFTAEGKSYDVPWTPSDRTLNVNNILPTGADYVWKARVVGDDPALSNETGGERLKDANRYQPPAQPDPTPSPSTSPIANPSKNPSTTLGVTPSTSRNVRSNRTSKALAGTVTVNTARRESAPVSPHDTVPASTADPSPGTQGMAYAVDQGATHPDHDHPTARSNHPMSDEFDDETRLGSIGHTPRIPGHPEVPQPFHSQTGQQPVQPVIPAPTPVSSATTAAPPVAAPVSAAATAPSQGHPPAHPDDDMEGTLLSTRGTLPLTTPPAAIQTTPAPSQGQPTGIVPTPNQQSPHTPMTPQTSHTTQAISSPARPTQPVRPAQPAQPLQERHGQQGRAAQSHAPSSLLPAPSADIAEFHSMFSKLVDNVSHVVVGKETPIRQCAAAMVVGGHILLEDNPGTGKTQLARGLANSIDMQFKRIQFTPDLLPSDVVGVTYYDQKTGEFEYREGPIFASIVLADEINRASPKTQSALLEVMEEQSVTVNGVTHPAPQPFMVIATQNPIEQLGTYKLPEAQMDRFLIKTTVGHPSHDVSVDILRQINVTDRAATVHPVLSGEDVLRMRGISEHVRLDDSILEYIVRLVEATRHNERIRVGSSMRGALALTRCARVWAAADNRGYVVPDDVKHLAVAVLAHRITLTAESTFAGSTPEQLIGQILEDVPVPTLGANV